MTSYCNDHKRVHMKLSGASEASEVLHGLDTQGLEYHHHD
jgi:hypothetical protein